MFELERSQSHVCEEEMSCTQHRNSEHHLVLQVPSHSPLRHTHTHTHITHHTSQPAFTGEILVPGEDRRYLLGVSSSRGSKRHLFLRTRENLPRCLQTMMVSLPTTPWPADSWQLGSRFCAPRPATPLQVCSAASLGFLLCWGKPLSLPASTVWKCRKLMPESNLPPWSAQ